MSEDLLAKAMRQRKEVAEEASKKTGKLDVEKVMTPKPKPNPKAKVTQSKNEEYTMEIVDKKDITKAKPKHELATTTNDFSMVSKDDIDRHLEMYNYVKQKIVDKDDFAEIKGGKKFLKKSGVRKFINAFNISIELIEETVFNLKVNNREDTHAKVRVKAILPGGQSVEGIGIKSMSELYDKNLHNLTATAWTRAVNRAVLDIVAFGEVSAEEINTQGNSSNVESMF